MAREMLRNVRWGCFAPWSLYMDSVTISPPRKNGPGSILIPAIAPKFLGRYLARKWNILMIFFFFLPIVISSSSSSTHFPFFHPFFYFLIIQIFHFLVLDDFSSHLLPCLASASNSSWLDASCVAENGDWNKKDPIDSTRLTGSGRRCQIGVVSLPRAVIY